MPVPLDLTGARFGKLTAVKRAANNKKQTVWECLCDCGNTVLVQTGHLRSGTTVSCGCYKRQRSTEIATRHGKSKSKLYNVWLSMRQRCHNPNCKDFSHWGGRGVNVCQEWDDYATFEAWATQNGYVEGLTIERVNVNGDYAPDNCTWIPRSEQMRNTTRTLNNR